jgi:hypothetical protein
LNNNRTTIGCRNRTTIEKPRKILCIDLLCLELVIESAMELARRGGDRKQVKVWKEREAPINIELIAHILKFYITSINFF